MCCWIQFHLTWQIFQHCCQLTLVPLSLCVRNSLKKVAGVARWCCSPTHKAEAKTSLAWHYWRNTVMVLKQSPAFDTLIHNCHLLEVCCKQTLITSYWSKQILCCRQKLQCFKCFTNNSFSLVAESFVMSAGSIHRTRVLGVLSAYWHEFPVNVFHSNSNQSFRCWRKWRKLVKLVTLNSLSICNFPFSKDRNRFAWSKKQWQIKLCFWHFPAWGAKFCRHVQDLILAANPGSATEYQWDPMEIPQ